MLRLGRFTLTAAAMSLFLSIVLSACATPGDLDTIDVSRRSPQPVVTQHGQATGTAAVDILAQATGETSQSERAELRKLTDAVRKSLSAPLIAGNRVDALVDGPETFAAIDRAIEGAQRHIHIETYIFANDALGRNFAQLLLRKRRQGVEVRIIYDAIGSIDTPAVFFDELRQAGAEVREFHPLNPAKTWLGKINNRDHRKLIVVDGRIAFTGGMNISSAYSSGSMTKPGPELGVTSGWRDTDVAVSGPAVEQFQTLFLDAWERLGGAPLQRANYFPSQDVAGNVLVSAVANNNGRQKEEAIYQTYMAAINNSSQRIWITQAYFSPPAKLRSALIRAARRGVDVHIILPGFTDSKLILYAAHSEYKRLLRGGVRIVEQQDALLHAKTVLIDESLVLIGSANLDYRSFLHNNEITAVLLGEQVSKRMAAVYRSDLSSGKELTLQEWKRRPLLDRWKESLSRLVKFWL